LLFERHAFDCIECELNYTLEEHNPKGKRELQIMLTSNSFNKMRNGAKKFVSKVLLPTHEMTGLKTVLLSNKYLRSRIKQKFSI
jgi:hypothetical protein